MGLFDYFRKKETELPKELVPVFATMHKARLGRKLADEALSHRNINNFDKALSLLKESLEKYDYIPAMSLISTTLILNEQYIEAIKWINNCLKNLNEENSYIKIELLANLGLIYYSKFKDYKKALEIYLESLSIPKPSNISDEGFEFVKSNIYRDLAAVYFCLGAIKNSEKYCKLRLKVVGDCKFTLQIKSMVEEYLDKFGTKDSEQQVITKDKYGRKAGKVTRNEDGKYSIIVDENSDKVSTLMAMIVVVSNFIDNTDKEIFSIWAELPVDEWKEEHQQKFSQTVLFYFYELKITGKSKLLPPEVGKGISLLPDDFIPQIEKPLTKEVIGIFNKLYGIKL